MPLAALQRALAHLYTDEGARERLRRDPGAFARSLALGPADLASVTSIGETRLHAYADSLDRKRANECARALPLSARALGPRFRAEFLRFARRVPLGAGPRRYRDDAVAFAANLTRHCGPAERALLAFEARSGPGIGFYRYCVPELARAAARGARIEDAEPRLTLVLRWSRGRCLALGLP